MLFFIEKNKSTADNKARSLKESGYNATVKKGIDKGKVVYFVEADMKRIKIPKPKPEKEEPTETELAEPLIWDAE